MTRGSYKRIKTTPMAPAGCHTHRHASRESYYKEHYLIHHNSSFITTSGHITSHDQSLQKQVRRPLIVVASFYVVCRFLARTISYLRMTTT